ncbi:MAG: hypothetical protein HC915_04840 [Anaerolineae bacterium]|nr:hypothetical protein [Anaerolineae bacterium]
MDDNGTMIQALFEGETFSIYRVEDADGDVGIDVTLFDSITVHFLKDEWNEFLEVMQTLRPEK